MQQAYSHDTFLSPFTWRYGSPEMRHIWSLKMTRLLWRRLWVALAQVQHEAGLVTLEQLEDLKAHMTDIDLESSLRVEEELKHDLMAEVHVYAEQCRVGGGIIHLGATSMDIEDNADVLRMREALDLLLGQVRELLRVLAGRIEDTADLVCMAFTHLQPAEPTTVGYRLAFTAQDLLMDYANLKRIRANLKGKGFKGAVGTSASYTELLQGSPFSSREFEAKILQQFDLQAFEVTHQTYPRHQDWEVLNALAGLAMTAYKFAFDLRLLQSPAFGEWQEPFGTRQIGSSAMPFKRNPIHSENIDSLARFVASLPQIAWENSAHHLLERTLDDSGNRRIILPEAFLATDEILRRLNMLVRNFRLDQTAIDRNLAQYGIFAATERLLMQAVRSGGDRQHLHEIIRQHSMTAWSAMQNGQPNPLASLLKADKAFAGLLNSDALDTLLDARHHIGDAPTRARNLAKEIQQTLAD